MFALMVLLALLSVCAGDDVFGSPVRGSGHRHHSSASTTDRHTYTYGPPSITTHAHTNGHLPSDILPRGDGPDKHTSESSHNHHSVSRVFPHHHTASSVTGLVHTSSSGTGHVHISSSGASYHHTASPVTTHVHTVGPYPRDEQHWSAWSRSTPAASHVSVSHTIGLGPERSSVISALSKASSVTTITSAPTQAPSRVPSSTSCATDDPLCILIGSLNSVLVRDIPHPTVATEHHSTESESESESYTSFHYGPFIPHQTEPAPNQHTHKWTWVTSYTWVDSTTQPPTPAPLATFSGNVCIDC